MEKRKSFLNQKGFSLVELIIVIAIMAILVAVMVPVLIKFIEKSNVSSDYQLADTVRGAFLCAVTDARVIEDPKSDEFFTALESTAGLEIDTDSRFLSTGSVMYTSAQEIIGIPLAQLPKQIKSSHPQNGSHFIVRVVNGDVTVEITNTDASGKKNPTVGDNIMVD